MFEPILFDTNILVYAHNFDSALHHYALDKVKDVAEGRLKGVLAQQNLLEFYSIVTDHKRVANPLSPKEAKELIKDYLNSPFEIIFPTKETSEILLSLCQENNIKNGEIFDIYLAATCVSNKIRTILTANITDFKNLTVLKVIDLNSELEKSY